MQPDPTMHLWMHDQEVQRTIRRNAILRAVKEAGETPDAYKVSEVRVNPIRARFESVLRVLRPAGTGGA